MTEDEFCAIVGRCKEAIRAGEVIQIVPSQKFTAKTDIPPLALYRALRLVNPSPYNFFLRVGPKTLIGSSPEELVRLEKGIGSIAPIAGTRPRGATPEMDRALEAELLADPKERAEHMMLVDLARNDLGRVAKTGTGKLGLSGPSSHGESGAFRKTAVAHKTVEEERPHCRDNSVAPLGRRTHAAPCTTPADGGPVSD
jgi:anthranilate synthase component 1